MNPPTILINSSSGCSTTTTSTHALATEAISEQLEELAMIHDFSPKRARNTLQTRHARDFVSDTAFDQFARVVCTLNCIPRKELFETWAMALYVYNYMTTECSIISRFADLACSHGLLSWALLVLSLNNNSEQKSSALAQSDTNNKNDNDNNNKQQQLLSAVCIDVRMPGSAEKAASAMLSKWPQLQDQWDYVEGSLEALEPSSSTLLLGVHACGVLSDKIIALAIQGKSPLALVPCCHSKKLLTKEQRQQLRKSGDGTDTLTFQSLADYVDNLRIERLRAAGFDVEEVFIPESFTPRNRIILARPNTDQTNDPTNSSSSRSNRNNNNNTSQQYQSTIAKLEQWKLPTMTIPVADSPEARATVRDMAGRDAADQRKQQSLRPTNFCISLLLPSDENSLTVDMLQDFVPKSVQVEVVDEQAFWHTKTGKYAKTFRFLFPGLTRDNAKELAISLCHQIPEAFPGAVARQIPK